MFLCGVEIVSGDALTKPSEAAKTIVGKNRDLHGPKRQCKTPRLCDPNAR
jgi:hypothetical protein